MVDRLQESASREKAPKKAAASLRRDFLDRFLEANIKDPVFISDQRVLALTVANIFAGADTTAITLRAVFYFLLKNPRCLQRLLSELASADLGPSSHIVSWEQSRNLPYLGAVVQESLRLHPAVGLALERIVPETGLSVEGVFLPAGTIVGTTARAIHDKQAIFGPDPEIYNPERWLVVSEAKRTEMNNALFSFGMGARTCIGKNISLLEMYKLVPTILRQYEVSFDHLNLSDVCAQNRWRIADNVNIAELCERRRRVVTA